MSGAQLVRDLAVGCLLIGSMLLVMYEPDLKRAIKRTAWHAADVVFHLVVTAVVWVINAVEYFMDRYWRLRCWLLRKPVRPY